MRLTLHPAAAGRRECAARGGLGPLRGWTGWCMAISVLLHSPLSLTSQARRDDYEAEMRGFGVGLFVGTQQRAPDELEVAMQHSDKYWRLSWGWSPGRFTNKAAGVAIWLAKNIMVR